LDQYDITQNGKQLCALFIHPYNRRISRLYPMGFLLASHDDKKSITTPQVGQAKTMPVPYSKIAAVIRYGSLVAAGRVTDLGEKNERQFHLSLNEFLAFFCTIACNEVCKQQKTTSREAVANCFAALCNGFYDEQPSDLTALHVDSGAKIIVAQFVNAPEFDFNSYFWSYWHGGLNSLGISESDIEEISKRGIQRPAHGGGDAAAYALLVRVSRFSTTSKALPPTLIFVAYDQIIREEVTNFLQALKHVLQ
jgi:hypothetical protein